MITNLLVWIMNVLTNEFSPLSSINLRLSVGFKEVLENYWCCAIYWFPIKELVPLILAILALMVFKITVSLIKTIWELLPIL